MLDRPGAADRPSLATWQAPIPLMGINLAVLIALKALPDHRRDYLSYEGPITDNRGWCRIADRGQYEPLMISPSYWQVRFVGGNTPGLAGTFWLKKLSGPDSWILARCLQLR